VVRVRERRVRQEPSPKTRKMTRSTETGSRATGTGSSATDDVTDDVSNLASNPYIYATLRVPPSRSGESRGRFSPVPEWPTTTKDLSASLSPAKVAREEILGPLNRVRDLSSIGKPIPEIDLPKTLQENPEISHRIGLTRQDSSN